MNSGTSVTKGAPRRPLGLSGANLTMFGSSNSPSRNGTEVSAAGFEEDDDDEEDEELESAI